MPGSFCGNPFDRPAASAAPSAASSGKPAPPAAGRRISGARRLGAMCLAVGLLAGCDLEKAADYAEPFVDAVTAGREWAARAVGAGLRHYCRLPEDVRLRARAALDGAVVIDCAKIPR